MFTSKILFPTDFSETSEAAFSHACELAQDSGASLVVMHVEELTLLFGESAIAVSEPDPGLRQRLEAIVPADPTIHCEHRLVRGDPASEIVRMAEAENADLIVMGTHGRTGLRRLLMGSVAESVLRHAGCPVCTIRHTHEALVGAH